MSIDFLTTSNPGGIGAAESFPEDPSRLKFLFLVTEDWYFWSHRVHLARALQSAGADVVIMTRIGRLRTAMEKRDFGSFRGAYPERV